MGIAIANRKNRCDFGALRRTVCVCVRDPQTHPKSRNTKKNTAFMRTFSKSSRELFPASCETSQEPNANCSEKLVQMNFFILGGFFRVDFPPVMCVCVCIGVRVFPCGPGDGENLSTPWHPGVGSEMSAPHPD